MCLDRCMKVTSRHHVDKLLRMRRSAARCFGLRPVATATVATRPYGGGDHAFSNVNCAVHNSLIAVASCGARGAMLGPWGRRTQP